MKRNLEFYQHDADSDSHPKFKMLRVSFGWKGDGKFWALNNRIARSENCCLDLSKKYIKASVASDLDFTMKEFDKFIDCLLVDCELIKEVEPGIITTDRIQETFSQVQLNREKARDRKQKNLEKVLKRSAELKESSGEPNNRRKVKESKGKDKKNKVPKKKPLLPYLQEKIIENNFIETKDKIFEFFEYRMAKPKREQYQTEKGINGLFRDMNKCREVGLIVSECLEISMEKGWLSPGPTYFNNSKPKHMSRDEKNKQECEKFIYED